MFASMRCAQIVVVEDDADIREALVDLLEAEGYSVNAFENGKKALEGLRRAAHPCLILLDLMMPEMNGLEFLRARQNQGTEIIPTYVVSAVANADVLQARDVVGYLRKPVDLHRLLEVVEAHCRQPANHGGPTPVSDRPANTADTATDSASAA
jgi:CheY-like chemotaxis protein